MVQILPEIPSFGGAFARALGGGFSQGVSQAQDYAQKLKYAGELEKLKRGTLIEQGKASIPKELQNQEAPSEKQLDTKNNVNQENIEKSSSYTSPILNPQQLKKEAANRLYQKSQQGLPSSYEDELRNLTNENQMAIQQRDIQNSYGDIGRNALLKYHDKATGEEQEVIARKIQNLANEGASESQIRGAADKFAKDFANARENIIRTVKPYRFFQKFKESAKGTQRGEEERLASAKAAVKPYIEEGLNDEVRQILSDPSKGYYPEEIESIVSSLDESATRNLNMVPNISKKKESGLDWKLNKEEPSDPRQLDVLSNTMKNIYSQNPSANLILIRKELMKKGYKWRDILNSFTDSYNDGLIKPTQEVKNQLSIIQEPPLDDLQKIFFDFGLRGK